jgi:hypothetical protein
VAYGYQYIPNARREEWYARAAERRANGESRMHLLDRSASAIAEAIAEVYRDIDELRRTAPELVLARTGDRSAEADGIA